MLLFNLPSWPASDDPALVAEVCDGRCAAHTNGLQPNFARLEGRTTAGNRASLVTPHLHTPAGFAVMNPLHA